MQANSNINTKNSYKIEEKDDSFIESEKNEREIRDKRNSEYEQEIIKKKYILLIITILF